MRITDQMAYGMVTSSILRNRDNTYATQEKLSSGKQINRPSDDPTAYERLARFRDDLTGIARYTDSVDRAKSELTAVDGVLKGVVDILQRVSEIAVQSSDGALGNNDRLALGEEVDVYLTELVNTANTTFDGHALFDGLQGGQSAYAASDTDGDGRTDTVTYLGNSGTRRVTIGNGVHLAVSVAGSDTAGSQAVFENDTVNLFNTLRNFRDRLLAGEDITTTDTVKQLQDCQDHVLGIQGIVGGRAESLTLGGKALAQQETTAQNAADDLESVDIAKGAMELARKQQAYDAALRAATTLTQNSLLDLLG